MKENEKREIKTTSSAFGIIESIAELDEPTLSHLAEESDLVKSTVHTHLKTLIRTGYVIKHEKSYSLSYKFLDLGMDKRESNPLVKTAQPVIRQVAEETEEVIWLYVEENGYAVAVDNAKGPRGVQIIGRTGSRKQMHNTSGGKAILAHLPDERIEAIIDQHGLKKTTENTITDREKLFSELEEIQEQGSAFNDEEEVEGIRAVGVPIVTKTEVQGALSASGPFNRLRGSRFREELPKILSGAANEIELKLSFE